MLGLARAELVELGVDHQLLGGVGGALDMAARRARGPRRANTSITRGRADGSASVWTEKQIGGGHGTRSDSGRPEMQQPDLTPRPGA